MDNKNKQIQQDIYMAPVVKVMEVKMTTVMCVSGNGTSQNYDDGSWTW